MYIVLDIYDGVSRHIPNGSVTVMVPETNCRKQGNKASDSPQKLFSTRIKSKLDQL